MLSVREFAECSHISCVPGIGWLCVSMAQDLPINIYKCVGVNICIIYFEIMKVCQGKKDSENGDLGLVS
jgi:hypothetical protein